MRESGARPSPTLVARAMPVNVPTNASYTLSCTKKRVGDTHTWPALRYFECAHQVGGALDIGAKVATRVADALVSGMVTINHFGIALPETPFGGIKDSGFGHEGGVEGLQVYMQSKFVSHLG